MTDHTLRNKILACLLGGAMGDALGWPVEFISWNAIRAKYGPSGIGELVLRDGQAEITDDTQMTLFTAEAMLLGYQKGLETLPGHIAEDIYQGYLCWLKTQGEARSAPREAESSLLQNKAMFARRAPGNTCIYALCSGKMGTPQHPLNSSKGCGGVMRTAPLGFFPEKIGGSALKNGADAAAITHGHPMGYIPAGMLSDIVSRCLYGSYSSLDDLIGESLDAVAAQYASCSEISKFGQLVRRAMALAQQNRSASADADEPTIRSLGEGWVGDEALAIAIYAVLRHGSNLKDCLRSAVNHSGDSDSTGAIAGNILGAFYGMDIIPADWLSTIELREEMIRLADEFEALLRGGAQGR